MVHCCLGANLMVIGRLRCGRRRDLAHDLVYLLFGLDPSDPLVGLEK